MPYVQAHTNAIGQHFRYVPAHSRMHQQIAPITGSVVSTASQNVYADRSYKTPLVYGFKSPIAPEFILPTAYTRIVSRFQSLSGYDMTYRTGTSNIYRIWDSDSRHTVQFSPRYPKISSLFDMVLVDINMRLRAETECLLKIKSSDLNLGATLGEARETYNHVSRNLYSLAQVIRYLLQKRYSDAWRNLFQSRSIPREVKRLMKDPHTTPESLWLSWAYGWRPLIGDIWAGVELIRKGFASQNTLFNVSRTIKQTLDARSFVACNSNTDGFYAVGTDNYESTQVQLWGMYTSPLHVLDSLGLVNPFALFWELTRLSFVIDWLIPIGNWLQSLSATLGVTFVGGCRTDIVYGWVEGHNPKPVFVSSHLTSGYNFIGTAPQFRHRLLGMQRTVYNNWPFVLPYFRNPLSPETAISAVALLSSLSR